MTWPTGAVETRSHESNADVNNVGGTVVDADDQNWVYDLLERIQTKVGPDTDTSAATSVEGRLKALEAVSALTDPMTATGDVIYSSDTSGTPARLGIGTTGQVLTVAAGLPAWADAATSGLADPFTTPGELLYRGASAPAALAIGSAGQMLGVSGGFPAWVTPGFIADPSGAPVGAVLVKNASSVWSYLAPSATTGDVLTGQGIGAVPIWTAVPAQVPGSDIPAPGGERVGAILQWNGTIYDKLLPGSAGQVLTAHGDNNVVGSLLTWATPSSGLTNPMTTLADLIMGNTGGAPMRLGIGSAGQVLTVVSGAPAWAANAAMLNPMTTLDDIIIGGASGAAARLAKGSNGQVLTISSSGHVVWQNSASGFADPTTTRGDLLYHGVSGTTRLPIGTATYVLTSDGTDAAWAAPTGGGGAGSRLARTTSGLVLWHDYATVPDHALTTSADALGYAVRTTYDHGTWAFRNGLLVCTAGANPEDCSNLSISQLYGVFQTRFYTPAVGSTQGGPEWAIQASVDTRMLYLVRNGDATVFDRTAGAWGAGHAGTAPAGMIQGQWIAAKVRWTATQVYSAWVNRVLLDSAFTYTASPTTAGGFGLVAVSAANTVFRDYAIYISTVLTVAGLSGTQAFRLLNAGGEVIATSGTQSSGSATIDLATVVDPPTPLVIEVHTSTAFTSLIAGGRYPAEGVAGDIWPGDTWTYT